jgi:hypothetical protein
MHRRAAILVPAAAVGFATTALASLGHPVAALALSIVPITAVILVTVPWALVFAVMLEMALGGWGHAVDFGPVSLRQALVGGLLAAWATRRLVTGDRAWPLDGATLAVLLALAVMGVALVVSLARGHEAALQDGLTPAFLLLFFVFSDLCRTPAGRRRLAKTFVLSVVVLGLLQIGLNALVFFGIAEPHALSARLGQLALFTVYSPRFARVFLVGSVLFPVGIVLLAARWLSGTPLFSRGGDLAALAVCGMALPLTFTRGFWLVTVAAMLALWLLTTRLGRLRWVLAGVTLLLVSLPLAATQPDAIALLSQRVTALVAGGGDESVAYRLELYPRLLEHIAKRPILGYGVGYPVDGLLYVENSYLYYALKVGLAGTAAVLMGWFWLLFSAARLAWAGATREARAVGAGWAAATAAILVITAINPFINSPIGMYFETLGLAIVTATARRAEVGRPVPTA